MVSVVVMECSGMRCQPLRRALCLYGDNVHIFILVLIGLAIPMLTPLLFKLFIAYVPGYMDGTEDGWLSYLGGYSGGFLAFISAYILFYKQKSLSDRCWFTWHISENTIEKEVGTFLSVLFSNEKRIKSFDYKKRMVLDWGVYGVAVIRLKNVSSNYAKSVDIKLVTGCSTIKPFAHRQESNIIAKWSHLSELESNETFEFVLHINPKLIEENKTIKFKISSESLTGVKSTQYTKLLCKNNSFELSN
ncbi:hypothetical protein [Vibrio cholerae]|uniref:hypothetical protein n=2 Tax=Vibrio cholerae TaxID=666 RepID=UPI0010FD3460|nr:hypothetical protein [Vibrio cholerae]TLE27896.1 hypothetical protein D2925_18320 [Vibrio cholerae]